MQSSPDKGTFFLPIFNPQLIAVAFVHLILKGEWGISYHWAVKKGIIHGRTEKKKKKGINREKRGKRKVRYIKQDNEGKIKERKRKKEKDQYEYKEVGMSLHCKGGGVG